MKFPVRSHHPAFGCLAVALSTFQLTAATIDSVTATWPTNATAETLDANNNSPGARGVTDVRINRQSFSVDTTFQVQTVYLSVGSYNNAAFTIQFFEISGVNDTGVLANESNPVSGVITVDPFGATGGAGNLQISLAPSERFSLPALTGGAGYVIRVQGATTGTSSFNWNHSNSGTDIYTLGRYRRDDGNTTNTRDYGLALEGSLIFDDSDNDGLDDLWEDEHFGNNDGLVEASDLSPQTGSGDPDNDGADNAEEMVEGTDPNVADTDGDDINDGDENTYGTSPLLADTDGDGLNDGVEISSANGSVTDPLSNDSDGDDLLDKWEIDHALDPNDPTGDNGDFGDPDNDTLDNLGEQELGTDPHLADTDGDNLDDYEEGNLYLTDPLHVDTDRDGLNDDVEVNATNGFATDALLADSDFDGYPDGFEVAKGTSPISAGSSPVPATSAITSLDAPWPTAGIQTVDALSNTPGSRALTGAREQRQSFTVDADIEVKNLYFSTQGYGDSDFLIQIFRISDTTDTNELLDERLLIGNPILVPAVGSAASGDRNIKVSVDPADVFTLPALAAPAGYVLKVIQSDASSPDTSITWAHSNSGADQYPDGRMRRDDGDITATRDFGLAITLPNDEDGDGLDDLWEDLHFGDNSGTVEPSDLTAQNGPGDPDSDGASNEEEETEGTDPNLADTDNDNINDGDEDLYGTNPLSADSDGDTITDGEEIVAGVDGYITNPASNDSDNDLLLDQWEIANSLDPTSGLGVNGDTGDPDSDQLDNFGEQQAGTNPQLADTDNDGLDDGEELDLFTNPLLADTDNDGLDDGEEVNTYMTDPIFADSDGDLASDGYEVSRGTDPNDINDFPAPVVAEIVDPMAAWPTGGVQTVDALNSSPGFRGVADARVNRQSFTVAGDILVKTIYLASSSYGNLDFTIRFYEIPGVNDTGVLANESKQVGPDIRVIAYGQSVASQSNLRIQLPEGEEFTLPALTGGAGYVMRIQVADGVSGTAFQWGHSNNGTDIYSGGRMRRDDGNTTNTRDYGLALTDETYETESMISVLSAGFNGTAFEVTYDGLDTGATYQWEISAPGLETFTPIGAAFTPASASETLSDSSPPAGKAFYRLSEGN